MMIKRFLSLACLALCACFGSAFASTMDKPSYVLSSLKSIGEFHGASVARLDIALVHWRSGGEPTTTSVASNLRAEGNHFVMSSARLQPEPADGETIAA
jgi:hypothetical protein